MSAVCALGRCVDAGEVVGVFGSDGETSKLASGRFDEPDLFASVASRQARVGRRGADEDEVLEEGR